MKVLINENRLCELIKKSLLSILNEEDKRLGDFIYLGQYKKDFFEVNNITDMAYREHVIDSDVTRSRINGLLNNGKGKGLNINNGRIKSEEWGKPLYAFLIDTGQKTKFGYPSLEIHTITSKRYLLIQRESDLSLITAFETHGYKILKYFKAKYLIENGIAEDTTYKPSNKNYAVKTGKYLMPTIINAENSSLIKNKININSDSALLGSERNLIPGTEIGYYNEIIEFIQDYYTNHDICRSKFFKEKRIFKNQEDAEYLYDAIVSKEKRKPFSFLEQMIKNKETDILDLYTNSTDKETAETRDRVEIFLNYKGYLKNAIDIIKNTRYEQDYETSLKEKEKESKIVDANRQNPNAKKVMGSLKTLGGGVNVNPYNPKKNNNGAKRR